MSDSISIGLVLFDEITHFENKLATLLSELGEHKVKEFLFILTSPHSETHQQFKKIFDTQLKTYRYWIFTENHIGKARAILVNECQTRLLYMVDPDIEIINNGLKKLIHQTHLIQNTVCGLAGEAILKSQNAPLNHFFQTIQNLNRFFKNNNQMLTFNQNQTIQHAPTCHLLLDVDKIKSVGNFSEKYSSVGEDLDLSHRLNNQGLSYLFIADATVLHIQNLTLSRWYQKMFKYGFAQAVCFNNNGFTRFMCHKYLLFLSTALSGLLLLSLTVAYPLEIIGIAVIVVLLFMFFFKNIFIFIISAMTYSAGMSYGLFLRKKTT